MSESTTTRNTGDRRPATATHEPVPATFRWGGASIAAGLAGCLVYAVDRTRAVWFEPPSEPLAVIASARIPYFYRLALAAFVASLVFVLWMAFASRRPATSFRWATRAVIPVTVVCTCLSIIWP